MGNKVSQLQIRVTPAEKQILKRLAAEAGETLSGYVLSKALPAVGVELAALMSRLAEADLDVRATFADLAAGLEEIPPSELAEAVPPPDLDVVPPVLLNRVAALVEADAIRRGGPVPPWTRRVAPLPRPHFGWSLTSLKPHQMRVTPAAFKRRNLFFDPADAPALAFQPLNMANAAGTEAPSPETAVPGTGAPGTFEWGLDLFTALSVELALTSIEVEFYFMSGALLFQTFSADPPTAQVAAQFQQAGPLDEAVRAVARAKGVAEGWPNDAARAVLRGTPQGSVAPYVELPRVRVFEPRPEYVLAVKCGAMNVGVGRRETDDLRYVLRSLNVTTSDVALSLVGGYLADRQLVPDVVARLEAALPS